MKKKFISCALSATMLFSTSFVVLPQNVLADAYSASQQLTSGNILFPNDIISFDSNSKLIYNSSVLSKEISVDNKMLILPNFADISTETVTIDSATFYGWKVLNDTIDSTSGKRTSLELAPVFIVHDTSKADLTITFPADNTLTKPSVKLSPKTGYVIDALATNISFNANNNEITISNPVLDENGNINLGDTYKEEAPTITLYKGTEQIDELTICPKSVSTMQFNAKAVYSSGTESTENISWSLNDDIEEFISIDNNGLVTVTPYFTGNDFTVTASIGDSSDSATIHLKHNYGEWTESVAPTISTEGVAIRKCSACTAQETKSIDKLQDKGFPIGTITVNAFDVWSDLASTIDYTHTYKNVTAVISAHDDVEVKSISYYVSNTALTTEQLQALSTWTSGNIVSLTSDGKYIIYVKITDSANNATYISTNGLLIDATAPAISGIENNQTYTEAKTFTVSDANLKTVKINDVEVQPINGVYTLNPENMSTYTIYACDIAGNAVTYTGNIYSTVYADQNEITGITENATYRKGSIVTFTAKGYNMNLSSPTEGAIRYIPESYSVHQSSDFSSGKYTQSIATSKLAVGPQKLSVIFRQQRYSLSEGWKNTNITDTKSVSFNIKKREEIESVRGTIRASFFTVKFDTNGGTLIDYVLVDRLKYLSEPVAPTKVGYKFDGWYVNSSLTEKYDFSQRVTSNMTLYAKWIKTSSSTNDNIFTDVSKDDKYYNNIAYVYASGLMNGTGNAEFSPDMPTTRAMIVTILYRLEGEPTTYTSSFNDVAPDAYYAKAVSWAQDSDIVNGMSYTRFAPNQEISREQLMTILYRYAEYKDYDLSSKASLSSFTDYDQISEYANNAFQWAIATKVATGRTEKFLSPKASATRGEVAYAFQNFIEGNEQ